MEAPDEWIEYDLGSLIAIRDELMEGDQRSLYTAWLASEEVRGGYDEEEEEGEDYEINVPSVPPGFGTLTSAQQALAELLQVPEELLVAASRHSNVAVPSTEDDFAAWLKLLPPERRDEYLLRLAQNEPGLNRQLVKELRDLGKGKTITTPSNGEHVTYDQLLAESNVVKLQLEREKREREQAERLRHLQDIYDHQNDYWNQVEQAVIRQTGTGYDEAVRLLIELREAAHQFKETQKFQNHFSAWVRPQLRRPAFVKRLQLHKFTLPEA